MENLKNAKSILSEVKQTLLTIQCNDLCKKQIDQDMYMISELLAQLNSNLELVEEELKDMKHVIVFED